MKRTCAIRHEPFSHLIIPSRFLATAGANLKILQVCLLLLLLWPILLSSATVPAGFADISLGGYWPEVTGLTFDETGRMYVSERAGRIWIFENDVQLPTPLIDISDEVGAWEDHGLLSVALHPNFRQNGYVYLYYVVDHHHLAYY